MEIATLMFIAENARVAVSSLTCASLVASSFSASTLRSWIMGEANAIEAYNKVENDAIIMNTVA